MTQDLSKKKINLPLLIATGIYIVVAILFVWKMNGDIRRFWSPDEAVAALWQNLGIICIGAAVLPFMLLSTSKWKSAMMVTALNYIAVGAAALLFWLILENGGWVLSAIPVVLAVALLIPCAVLFLKNPMKISQ